MPEIVVLEGDRMQRRINLRELMDADDFAAWRETPYLSGEDIEYLNYKYPEMLGVWATVAVGAGKVLKRVGGLVRRIAQRVRERRASRKGQQQSVSQQSDTMPEESQRFYRTGMPAQLVPGARAAAEPAQLPIVPIAIGAVLLLLVMQQRGKK